MAAPGRVAGGVNGPDGRLGHAGRAHRSGIVRDQAPEPTGGTLRTAGNEAHGLSRLRVTSQTTAHTAATTASGSAGSSPSARAPCARVRLARACGGK